MVAWIIQLLWTNNQVIWLFIVIFSCWIFSNIATYSCFWFGCLRLGSFSPLRSTLPWEGRANPSSANKEGPGGSSHAYHTQTWKRPPWTWAGASLALPRGPCCSPTKALLGGIALPNDGGTTTTRDRGELRAAGGCKKVIIQIVCKWHHFLGSRGILWRCLERLMNNPFISQKRVSSYSTRDNVIKSSLLLWITILVMSTILVTKTAQLSLHKNAHLFFSLRNKYNHKL